MARGTPAPSGGPEREDNSPSCRRPPTCPHPQRICSHCSEPRRFARVAARLTALALAWGVLACGRNRTPVAVTAVAGAPAGAQAVVTAKNGKVELLRAADGTVSEAQVGDRLTVRDALRTEVGEADLAV